MAENEIFQNEATEVSSPKLEINVEIGDQKTEPLEILKNLEKCSSQLGMFAESCKSRSLVTTPIIKSPVRTGSKINMQSENRAARLAATTRLISPTLRSPTSTPNAQPLKPMTRKVSNLSTASGITGTNSSPRTLRPRSIERNNSSAGLNCKTKKLTPTTSKDASHESLKPVSYIQKPSVIPIKKPTMKYDTSSARTTKSGIGSKIPVSKQKVNTPKVSGAKNKPDQQRLAYREERTSDNRQEDDMCVEARSNIDYEMESEGKASFELKQIQRRINTVTNTCMKIVNKTHDNETVLDTIKSIDLNECMIEKLKLVAQLFDMCCKEHKEQKEHNRELKEENNDLKTQVGDFAAKFREFKQKQMNDLETPTVDSEILARDNSISELKIQLENSIFELNSYKIDNEEKIALIAQQENILKKYQADINRLEEKVAFLQNKLNVCARSIDNSEELQEQIEDLETKLGEKTTECADTLHKAQQFFTEMMDLKEHVKDLRDERQSLHARVLELEKRLHEYEHTLSEENLKETECCKSFEIDRLKIELLKARHSILELEEENLRYQQLLDLKGDVMNSLEQTENEQNENHMEFKEEASEETNNTNDLTNQFNGKTVDWKNVLALLNQKQLLISQQEQEIRMLKEGNDRSQFLRLKQEEKIARLEDKINNLQQILYKHRLLKF